MASSNAQIAHIWRRLGFGPKPGDLAYGVSIGPTALIEELCARPMSTASDWAWANTGHWTDDPLFFARNIELMSHSNNPLQARMTWILMGLLVITRTDQIHLPQLKKYVGQLRGRALGSYTAMLSEVLVDAGMQWYLNGFDSTREHPNENLARELMELFSIGVSHPNTGAANYTELDVKEIARALTGYSYNFTTESAVFNVASWDSGTKYFLGAPRGAAAVAEVLSAVFAHPSYRLSIARRFYRELVGIEPTVGALNAAADAFGSSGDLRALARAIALRPEFLSDAAINARIRCPVELIAGSIRALDLRNLYVETGGGFYLDSEMETMQQQLFRAPNVNGWPQGKAWLHPGYLIGW